MFTEGKEIFCNSVYKRSKKSETLSLRKLTALANDVPVGFLTDSFGCRIKKSSCNALPAKQDAENVCSMLFLEAN